MAQHFLIRLLLTVIVWLPPRLSPAEDNPGLPVGSPMSDFGLRRVNPTTGAPASMVWLSDHVGPKASNAAKKLVLLNFFATWCKPCLEELPLLAKLQQQYGPTGLQVLSVNFHTESEKVDDALKGTVDIIKRLSLNFPVLFDRYTNRNQLIYMGTKAALPCNVLIDARGIVVARFQGARASTLAELEAAVQKHLKGEVGPTTKPAPLH